MMSLHYGNMAVHCLVERSVLAVIMHMAYRGKQSLSLWNFFPSQYIAACPRTFSNCVDGQYQRHAADTSSDISAVLTLNHLTPNGHYMGRTAQLTSRCCILYIYSTNIRTEYFNLLKPNDINIRRTAALTSRRYI